MIYLFRVHHKSCKILVPWSGHEPVSPAVETQNLNPWTIRDIPSWFIYLPTYLPTYLSVCLSVYLPIYLLASITVIYTPAVWLQRTWCYSARAFIESFFFKESLILTMSLWYHELHFSLHILTLPPLKKKKKNLYLFIWLHWVLAATWGI